MARRPNIQNPSCPKCGERSVSNGSVRRQRRYKCIKCRKSFGENSTCPLSHLKTSPKVIIQSLLKVQQVGSFNKAERLTGHKIETLSRWVRVLFEHQSQMPSSFISALNDLGMEINTFMTSLKEGYEELNRKEKIWTKSILPVKTKFNLYELVPLIEKAADESEILVKTANVKKALDVLYEPLWEKIIMPSDSTQRIPEKLLVEIFYIDNDLAYKFIQTLPLVVVTLELSARWSETMAFLERIIDITRTPVSEFPSQLKMPFYLIQQMLFDSWGSDRLMDWCYMKNAQFLQKFKPTSALELTYKRREFQSQKKFEQRYPELLLNTKTWTVHFRMKAGRMEEKSLYEDLKIINEQSSPKSLFPKILLARYYSWQAINANVLRKTLPLTKMERICDDILHILKPELFSKREIAATHVDIAQLYQKHRPLRVEEMERLDKATQISLRYGYAGQAKQLLKLIENKRFDPGEYTVKLLQELASTIKGDKYYR